MIAMFEVWLPDPLTVATTSENSLRLGSEVASARAASLAAGTSRFIPSPLSGYSAE